MKVGFAEADVTPPVGDKMSAFPAGPDRAPRRAEGVRDPLLVRVLALSDGLQTVCLCAGDLVTWMRPQIAWIEQAVRERGAHLGPVRLQFTATHSHSSLENTGLFGGRGDDPAVLALQERTAEAVLAACKDLCESTMSVGQVEAPLNHNRRVLGPDGQSRMVLEHRLGETEGPTDPTLTVVRFDRADQDSLLWVHWTAHALTLGPPNRQFSADYPGALRAAVQSQLPQKRVLFTNGAAGNVHPRQCMRVDDSAIAWLTRELTAKVLAAVESAEPLEVLAFDLQGQTLSFPNRADESLAVEAEVSCLRFHDQHGCGLAAGFLPGEPFVEFQLRFREALKTTRALLCGYSNAWAGYVPTREAYAEGGYGVDFCSTDPPHVCRTMLPEGAGEKMLEAVVALAGT